MTRAPVAFLVLASIAGLPAARAADDATAQAAVHYDLGLKLFENREHEQALIEFQTANELKPRPAALFMMAQCEYLLGRLKEARAHFESYAKQNPGGEFVKLAEDRVQSIDRRLSTFVINTVPDDVTVRIVPEGGPGPPGTPITGQAPNNFQVPRGRYRIDVTKPQYLGQTRTVDVDIAETKPLFFKLDPIPARLEIETFPPNATLYVNGNRARNPYRQDVIPGRHEIFGEAPDYDPRAVELTLAPGERRLLTGAHRFTLHYVQRSGRPELIFASGLVGGFVGAGAVAAGIGGAFEDPDVSTVLLVGGGAVSGFIGGALIATPLVPHYIPDNRALFVLGAMWIGAVEGALAGIVWRQANPACTPEPGCLLIGAQLRPAFIGSLPGLAIGLTGGALLAKRAPTYGRVALIQSAALSGVFVGGLVQLATQWQPYGRSNRKLLDFAPGAIIGLNGGLVAGLLGAYLPDQKRYGPSWKRVLLIDLAATAGAVAGGVAGCVSDVQGCLTRETDKPDDNARSRAAVTALIGAAIGLGGGVLLTRHFDDAPPAPKPVATTPLATVLPLRGADGRFTTGVGLLGNF